MYFTKKSIRWKSWSEIQSLVKNRNFFFKIEILVKNIQKPNIWNSGHVIIHGDIFAQIYFFVFSDLDDRFGRVIMDILLRYNSIPRIRKKFLIINVFSDRNFGGLLCRLGDILKIKLLNNCNCYQYKMEKLRLQNMYLFFGIFSEKFQ